MKEKDVYILGIESSCDDTSAAVLHNDVLLSNVTSSQDVHKAYGGVVPELASRAHQQNIVPVVDLALKRAGITKEQLSAISRSEFCKRVVSFAKYSTDRCQSSTRSCLSTLHKRRRHIESNSTIAIYLLISEWWKLSNSKGKCL